MKKNLLSIFESFPYFTTQAIKQLSDERKMVDGSVQTALYRWMRNGEIISLKKGVYMTRRFYELHRTDIDFAPAISAVLIPQSYLSLHFVLQRAGILTDVTYPVSAVTIKNTRRFENPAGTFTYQHLKEVLFQGFSLSEYYGIVFAQASPAKALFDYLYLRPISAASYSFSNHLAEELRLNMDDFSAAQQEEFAVYAALGEGHKMNHVLKNFRRHVWPA